MSNSHVYQRLEGILTTLDGVHSSNKTMSPATKGEEREVFVNTFLSEVFPLPYRFGSGDITDCNGNKSGQLDIVIEFPIAPSLPLIISGNSNIRLYLSEGVAAVIEVKSNIENQFDEAIQTADKLALVRRNIGPIMSVGEVPFLNRIPFFVVGYTGWKTKKTVKTHLEKNSNIDGILVIKSRLFESKKDFRGISAQGPWALWGLISCIHRAICTIPLAAMDPVIYMV